MKKVNYVGCFLVLPSGDYVLQRRDADVRISNPGVISTFGGRVKPGESNLNALKRELFEELELETNEEDLKYVGYIERYDEFKNHMVECEYYYYQIKRAPNICKEGTIVLIKGDEVIKNPNIGIITKEMHVRIIILKKIEEI